MDTNHKVNAASRAAEDVIRRLSARRGFFEDVEDQDTLDEIKRDVQDAILEELMCWTNGIGRTG